jgi:hypothetical protein
VRFERIGERLNMSLSLLVEIRNGEVCAEGPEGSGAPPGDRVLVRDADDEAALAGEELGLGSRDERRPLGDRDLDRLAFQMALGEPAELVEELLRVRAPVDMCDILPVNGEASLPLGATSIM